jgi:hypothetical protein
MEGDRHGDDPGDEIPEPTVGDASKGRSTLLSAGTAPSSALRKIPLERAAKLDAAEIARADAVARRRGITREQVLRESLERGLAIAKRWRAKLAAARLAGWDVAHCGSPACVRSAAGLDGCACGCAPCARRASLLAEAEREVCGDDD